MTILDLNGNSYVDVHALPIEDKDLIVLRSDRGLDLKDYEELTKTINASNPDWRGGLLVLKTDESIEKLDAQSLLQLYQVLKKMFEEWESYVEIREAEDKRCIRCGSALSSEDTPKKKATIL